MRFPRPPRAIPAALALAAAVALAGCNDRSKECHAPFIECGERCVDGSSDPANCGGCGVSCGPGLACCGACVDLSSDPEQCGACGRRCGLGTCGGGVCTCTGGGAHCAADPWPWCRDLSRDLAHCGACDAPCTFPRSGCEGGACGCYAPAPVTCAGSCSDLALDPDNCGTCGETCSLPGKTRCSGGSCACASAALSDCGAEGCFDLLTSAQHCGGSAGACGPACPAGAACCGGACKVLANDAQHCGSCDHPCPGAQSCASGTCACPGAAPRACGASCCAGTACCASGTACQTRHSNGLGDSFFDCNPTYTSATTTDVAALAAADAWHPGTTYPGLCGGSCVGRQTTTSCAVWCYFPSPWAGRVRADTSLACDALCPQDLAPFLTWQ